MGLLRSLVTATTSVLLLGLDVSPFTSAVSTGVSQQHRVDMRIFFRAFCPACQWFVEYPLLKLVQTEEYRNIVNLTLVPAAGMQLKQDGTLTCEAGPLECIGHRWQACVLEKNRDDVSKYLSTIACLEGDESGQPGDWMTKMQKCVTDEERIVVNECFDNQSKDLLAKMIREEQVGSVSWMPYTVVNQKVLGTAADAVTLDILKKSICSAYTGPKSFYPAECVKLVGKQKVFAAEDPVVSIEGKSAENNALASTIESATNTEVMPPIIQGEDNGIAVNTERKEATPVPANAPAIAGASGKVQLELYWRAFCPGCVFFISKTLLSLLRDKEFQEIIDFYPVPAAGMFYDAEKHFVCAGGKVECIGHKWLSCAVAEFQQIGDLVERLACMENKENNGMTWSGVISRCFEGEAYAKLKTCYNVKGSELLRQNVAKKQARTISWAPYVILNGVPLGDSAHGIGLKQLTDAVCEAYSGPKHLLPMSCQPKRLRDEAGTNSPAEAVAVKPCPAKKKGTGATGAKYDDAPGIGKPLLIEPEAKTVTEFGAKVFGGKEADDDGSSAIFTALVLPGMCFVGIVVIALRLTRSHKKDV